MPTVNSRLRVGTWYKVELTEALFSAEKNFDSLPVYIIERPDLDVIMKDDRNDKTIQVKGGERLDILAARYYQDDTLHWVPALRNNIGDMWSIVAGDELIIPSRARVKGVLSR